MIVQLCSLLAHMSAVLAIFATSQGCRHLSRTDVDHLMSRMDHEVATGDGEHSLLDWHGLDADDRDQVLCQLITQWGKRTAYYDFHLINILLPGRGNSTPSLVVRRSLAARLAKEPELCRQWFLYPVMRASIGPGGFHLAMDGLGPEAVKSMWRDGNESCEHGRCFLTLLHLAAAFNRLDVFVDKPNLGCGNVARGELMKLLKWVELNNFNFYYHRCSASFQLAVVPSSCDSCKENAEDAMSVIESVFSRPKDKIGVKEKTGGQSDGAEQKQKQKQKQK